MFHSESSQDARSKDNNIKSAHLIATIFIKYQSYLRTISQVATNILPTNSPIRAQEALI